MATNEKKVEVEKTDPLVNVKRENYVSARTAAGTKSLHNNDIVANGLQGLTIDELYVIFGKYMKFPIKVRAESCADVDEVQAQYAHLNVGMQRMNMGNRIRGRVGAIDEANLKAEIKAKADGKEPKSTLTGEEKLAKVLAPFIKAREKREVEATKAREKAIKEDKEAKEKKVAAEADTEAA